MGMIDITTTPALTLAQRVECMVNENLHLSFDQMRYLLIRRFQGRLPDGTYQLAEAHWDAREHKAYFIVGNDACEATITFTEFHNGN